MPESTTPINSAPALAAAIRTTGLGLFTPVASKPLAYDALVPMYRVRNTSVNNAVVNPVANPVDYEVEDAVRLVGEISERLRRLSAAYGEWGDFEAGAYFDLTKRQINALVKVTERVSTVHVSFRTDLLLPAFRRSSAFWSGQYCAAHAAFQADHGGSASESRYDDDFLLDTQPAMQERWQRLMTVINAARHALADDPGFLGMSAHNEEQMAVRQCWARPPVRGVIQTLTPGLSTLPTLTLSYDFPLPPHRQSGRVRRLRQNRERRRRIR